MKNNNFKKNNNVTDVKLDSQKGSFKMFEDCSCNSQAKGIFSILALFLTLFIGVLIILNIVNIQNKIKEGRYIGQEIESKNSITVAGTGEVYAKPDLALIVFSVQTEAKTVDQALLENSNKMNNIISVVKNMGVQEKDLKTISFNIYPLYEYIKETEQLESYYYPSGKRVLTGYQVTQSLQIKIRELAKTGEIVQAAVDQGANQAGDLVFTIDNEDELKVQAREEAIAQAKETAKEIASRLGVRLVKITGFSESGTNPYYNERYTMAPMAMDAGKGGEPQIETGENKISSSVSITYEID